APGGNMPFFISRAFLTGTLAVLALSSWLAPAVCAEGAGQGEVSRVEQLPPPDREQGRPLAALLDRRSSVRFFTADTLDTVQLGQLLWATCGTTTAPELFSHRTIPSAGALFPLEVYLLPARGVAHYAPQLHALEWLQDADRREDLAQAALGQGWVKAAPAVFVIAAEPGRTTGKYGERGERYVIMEAGFAAQNLLLQAVDRGLGGVPVGAFQDEAVAGVLQLSEERLPLLIVPVGVPRKGNP
ncbi:MAG: SagB/ThcOx family dehydrogenase, partial [Candidatus Eisenbacteria bacterium]